MLFCLHISEWSLLYRNHIWILKNEGQTQATSSFSPSIIIKVWMHKRLLRCFSKPAGHYDIVCSGKRRLIRGWSSRSSFCFSFDSPWVLQRSKRKENSDNWSQGAFKPRQVSNSLWQGHPRAKNIHFDSQLSEIFDRYWGNGVRKQG